MKKLSYIIMAFATLIVPFALASCSDDDDYTPAKDVAADCPTVYFSNVNESEIFVTSDSEKSFTLTLARQNTAGTITVPVIVETMTGSFHVPESVTFNDGEATAELTVTYDEFEGGMNFMLSLGEDYVNPYVELPGSTMFKVTLSQLNKVCDVAYATDTRFAKVTGSSIYAYSGVNKFRWVNFMGSGIDLTFTVDTSNSSGAVFDANDITKLKGDIIPMDYYTKDDYGYHFVNPAGSEDYVTWTPEGQTEAVTKFYFYGYYSGHYTYIDFSPGESSGTGYGYFWSSVVNSDDNYENIYFYLYY